MARIAILGPRPNNDSILTKKDGKVWNELKRVLYEDLSKPEWKGHTFLIPIYTKFDLEILRICELNSYPVEFYVPNDRWGKEKLPQHRTALVNRTMTNNVHIIPGQINRMKRMLQECDGIYLLNILDDFAVLQSYVESKPVRVFPVQKMKFTSEEELTGQLELAIEETSFVTPETFKMAQSFVRYTGETNEQYQNRIMQGPFS